MDWKIPPPVAPSQLKFDLFDVGDWNIAKSTSEEHFQIGISAEDIAQNVCHDSHNMPMTSWFGQKPRDGFSGVCRAFVCSVTTETLKSAS